MYSRFLLTLLCRNGGDSPQDSVHDKTKIRDSEILMSTRKFVSEGVIVERASISRPVFPRQFLHPQQDARHKSRRRDQGFRGGPVLLDNVDAQAGQVV